MTAVGVLTSKRVNYLTDKHAITKSLPLPGFSFVEKLTCFFPIRTKGKQTDRTNEITVAVKML
jgi:hypothetical protein